jgi:2-keto-4-pentenoate hydratase
MKRQTSGTFLTILAALSLTTVTARVALSLEGKDNWGEFSIASSQEIDGLPVIVNRYNPIITEFSPQIFARQLTESYFTKIPVEIVPSSLTPEQGSAVQAEFVRFLKPHLGNIIGYKAALTNKVIQERFNVSQPVLGVLLEKMLLTSGTTVSANFGAVPRLEGDLMVRVGSEKINKAKTPVETLQCLDAVIPFLELPDLIYAPNVKVNGSLLQAINAGARLGIVGQPIPLNASEGWEKRLNQIEVIIFDESGKELARGKSSALLGDPLEVVFWIKNNLQQQGKSLKKGDLLSLGSITPLLPVAPGKTIYTRYIGLMPNRPLDIFVHF